MIKIDVVEAIREYADLLRKDELRCSSLEAKVAELSDDHAQQVLEFYDSFIKMRHRDFAILIRQTQIIEKRFLAGRLDWLATKRDMDRFERSFRVRGEALDNVLNSALKKAAVEPPTMD